LLGHFFYEPGRIQEWWGHFVARLTNGIFRTPLYGWEAARALPSEYQIVLFK
jgi:hypothetical protein